MVPCELSCRLGTGKHRVNELRRDQVVLPQHTSKKVRFKGRKRKKGSMSGTRRAQADGESSVPRKDSVKQLPLW